MKDNNDLIVEYINIIIQYINYINTRKQYIKDFKNVLLNTLEIMNVIFTTSVLHCYNTNDSNDNNDINDTKENLIITYTEKGYMYFIEFIEQISHDKNSLLELTINDAKLFVYKKTIYNFDNFGEKFTNKKLLLIIEIINNIIKKLFVDNNEIYDDDDEVNNLIKNIKKVQSTIDILFTFDEDILETANKFAKNINLNQNNNVDVVSLYKKFIKNINNKNIDIINEKLLSIKNKEMYNSESEYKYLRWLFN